MLTCHAPKHNRISLLINLYFEIRKKKTIQYPTCHISHMLALKTYEANTCHGPEIGGKLKIPVILSYTDSDAAEKAVMLSCHIQNFKNHKNSYHAVTYHK